MMAYETVRFGDCAQSLAADHGLTWEQVWWDGNNGDLRRRREESNILLTGDRIYIPDTRSKTEPGETEVRHKFRVEGQPARLILRLKRSDEPLANKPYVLKIDGDIREGETNDEGCIDVAIPPNTKDGKLVLNDGKDSYDLVLGGLDPLDETFGLQERLYNLGFAPGPIDGIAGPLTEAAVRRFQRKVGATVDGIVGPETRGHLETEYGC